MDKTIVFGERMLGVTVPDDTFLAPAGVTVPLPPTEDLEATIREAVTAPIDRPPLREQVRPGGKVTIAFDDPTVPCYAPMWATALPILIHELERCGVKPTDISLLCANALHRKFTLDELARTIGDDIVKAHKDRISCHDAEDPDGLAHLGTTENGWDVVLNKKVIDSDLTIYLNCSTMRGFSGGWKSICVGLSDYRSIKHHHTPDIMSMSMDRNRMHGMLDEMGALAERELGAERLFKIETVLSNPLQVHTVFSGSVGATRAAAMDKLRAHQPPRRDFLEEPVDIVVYGVPAWSPYAAFSHTNPILDLISTGLGYFGGVIQAFGKKGCTVVLATPCPNRWDERHHPSYPEVWDRVLPETRDPDEARQRFEPELAQRDDYIDLYRNHNAFHPVHAVMAIYPLKRLRHAGRVIVAGAEDEATPRHCGFDAAPTVERAIDMAKEVHGPNATVALVEYPQAFNRS